MSEWERLKAEWRAHFQERRALVPFTDRGVAMVDSPVPSEPWDKLSPSERNQTVARTIGWTYESPVRMGYTSYWTAPDGQRYTSEELPNFVGSLDAARIVEDEIERRDLTGEYIEKLLRLTMGDYDPYEIGLTDLICILQVTPDERCRAALRVMGVEV